ncbi:phage head morphogenesis protein [Lacticaseibacillus paracasei]|uniref:phage head morphogenesis protein n=1 Tax=Lacticaseibacillus paracasei TaxID=1597 RepID=UPI0031D20541
MTKTPKERIKAFADKQDKQHRQIASDVAKYTAAFMAFWYAFNEKHEDYTHADDSRYYDLELKEKLDRDAQEAGVQQKSVANNDELLSYAAYVYSTAVAVKAVEYIGITLGNLAKQTAKLGSSIYGKHIKADLSAVNKMFDGATWSDRIWSNQDALRSDLQKMMKNALLTHSNPITQSPALRDKFGVMKYQSDRIIRTESDRVMAHQSIVNAREAGYKKVTWVINSGACNICLQHSGEVYTLKQADGMIPAHPNCLCSWAAYDTGDEVNDD